MLCGKEEPCCNNTHPPPQNRCRQELSTESQPRAPETEHAATRQRSPQTDQTSRCSRGTEERRKASRRAAPSKVQTRGNPTEDDPVSLASALQGKKRLNNLKTHTNQQSQCIHLICNLMQTHKLKRNEDIDETIENLNTVWIFDDIKRTFKI